MIMNFYMILGIFLLFLLMAINLLMFISFIKQGDERRKMIVQKAGNNTFAITAVYLVFCLIEDIIKSCTQAVPMKGMNPFIVLTVMSIMYFVQLLYFKKKYGA